MVDARDPLHRFREDAQEELIDDESVERALLIFEHGTLVYAVPASSVDAVVAWHEPAPLPSSVPGLLGVVQDRGRIIAVLASPLGQPTGEEIVSKRIVICKTPRGFLGLPCSNTRHIGPVRLASGPSNGELVDSSSGPILFADPSVLAMQLGG